MKAFQRMNELFINLVRSVIAERLDADESFSTGVLCFPLTASYPQTSSELAQYDWNTTTHPHVHLSNSSYACGLIPCGFNTSLDVEAVKLNCFNFCYANQASYTLLTNLKIFFPLYLRKSFTHPNCFKIQRIRWIKWSNLLNVKKIFHLKN